MSDRVEFRTEPSSYRHWKLAVDGPVATLSMDVDETGGLREGYELKLNSYDLGVDIELYDAVQRLRFEHPEVRTVVLTSGKDKIFCAGANIRMLAASPHPWKVNFCKFTNETRNGIEDATANCGQTYLAALNGTASGGGYELALACDHIMLVDDRSSTVSLPELPLLGVLPGTGGLTRVVDKRHVRRDRADYFATKSEGSAARRPCSGGWSTRSSRDRSGTRPSPRARRRARASARPVRPTHGHRAAPLDKTRTDDDDRLPVRLARRSTATAAGRASPFVDRTDGRRRTRSTDADFWTLALTRELDDLILDLRTNELELGTWVLRTTGDPAQVLAHDALLLAHRDDWLANEIVHYLKRTLKRLDVTVALADRADRAGLVLRRLAAGARAGRRPLASSWPACSRSVDPRRRRPPRSPSAT